MPIVSPQLSPPDAVHHIKEHLSRLFVLMYNLLATVNNQEGDVQQRATLHCFRDIKEPGNKVLLTIAKEDLQGYSMTLPSLDLGDPRRQHGAAHAAQLLLRFRRVYRPPSHAPASDILGYLERHVPY